MCRVEGGWVEGVVRGFETRRETQKTLGSELPCGPEQQNL